MMALVFVVRMSSGWLTISLILFYANGVDALTTSFSSPTITTKTTSSSSEESWLSYHSNRGNRRSNYNYDDDNDGIRMDSGGGLNGDDDDNEDDNVNTHEWQHYGDFSMKNYLSSKQKNRLEPNHSNDLRDHLNLNHKRKSPAKPSLFSYGDDEELSEIDGEQTDLEASSSSLRSIHRIPDEIRKRFFDPNHHQTDGAAEYSNEPVATPLIGGRPEPHLRRHRKFYSHHDSWKNRGHKKRKRVGWDLNKSNKEFSPNNHRGKGYCVKKIMRNIWKLNCKQYINLKRLNLINNNKMDLTKLEIQHRLQKCLALFKIS